jgi:hypothetical protein
VLREDNMTTIKADTDSVTAVWFSILGGKFRIRLSQDDGPGRRIGEVLDDSGNVIGSAQDYTYGGNGFAVHTRPFGGFVPMEQVEFVY